MCRPAALVRPLKPIRSSEQLGERKVCRGRVGIWCGTLSCDGWDRGGGGGAAPEAAVPTLDVDRSASAKQTTPTADDVARAAVTRTSAMR